MCLSDCPLERQDADENNMQDSWIFFIKENTTPRLLHFSVGRYITFCLNLVLHRPEVAELDIKPMRVFGKDYVLMSD